MIIAAFLFISILLVWLIIGSKGIWYLKLTMLLTSVLLGIFIWKDLNTYKGWAYDVTWKQMEGQKATLLAFEAKEPNSIWLWIIPQATNKSIFAYRPWPGEPISLHLPYRRSAAQQLNNLKKDQNGRSEIIFISLGSNGSRTSGGNNSNNNTEAIGEIYQLPPPKLPEKVQ